MSSSATDDGGEAMKILFLALLLMFSGCEMSEKSTDEFTDTSEITTNRVKEDGKREIVPLTRRIDGVKVRTMITEIEMSGKIIATKDVVMGLGGFSEYGHTDEEISNNESILQSVGVEEIYIDEIISTNDTMEVAIGYVYDSDMQINLTFENNELFYVILTGIVEDHDYNADSNSLDLGIGLQGKDSIELYYEGILAYLDWEEKTLDNQ